MSVSALEEFVNDPQVREFLSVGDRLDQYGKYRRLLDESDGTMEGMRRAAVAGYDQMTDPELKAWVDQNELVKMADALDAFERLRATSRATSGGEQTAEKVVASAHQDNFRTFFEEFRRTGDESTTTFGSVSTAVSEQATPETVAESIKNPPIGRVDTVLRQYPELGEVVEGSRDRFEQYAALVERYYELGGRRTELAGQASAERGIPFEQAQDILTRDLKAIYDRIVQFKQSLPDTKLSPQRIPERVGERTVERGDPFPLPLKPTEREEGFRGALQTVMRGLTQDILGIESTAQRSALQFPHGDVPALTGEVFGHKIVPNAEMLLRGIGQIIQYTPLLFVSAPAGGAVAGRVVPKIVGEGLKRAMGRGAVGLGTAGAVEGALRPDVAPGDVKARARGAAEFGAGGAVLGAAGPPAARALRPVGRALGKLKEKTIGNFGRPKPMRRERRVPEEPPKAEAPKESKKPPKADVKPPPRKLGETKATPAEPKPATVSKFKSGDFLTNDEVGSLGLRTRDLRPAIRAGRATYHAIEKEKTHFELARRLKGEGVLSENQLKKADFGWIPTTKKLPKPKPVPRDAPLTPEEIAEARALQKQAEGATTGKKAAPPKAPVSEQPLPEIPRRKFTSADANKAKFVRVSKDGSYDVFVGGEPLKVQIRKGKSGGWTYEGSSNLSFPTRKKALASWMTKQNRALSKAPPPKPAPLAPRKLGKPQRDTSGKFAKRQFDEDTASLDQLNRAGGPPPPKTSGGGGGGKGPPKKPPTGGGGGGKKPPGGKLPGRGGGGGGMEPPTPPPGASGSYPSGSAGARTAHLPPIEEVMELARNQIRNVTKGVRWAQRTMDAEEYSRRIKDYLHRLHDPDAPLGEKAFRKASKALKGELPVADFSRLDIPAEHATMMYEYGRNSGRLFGFNYPEFDRAVTKLLMPDGMRKPADHELALLARVFGEDFASLIARKTGIGQSKLKAILGGTRALVATADLSASLRQMIVLGSGYPRSYIRAQRKALGAMWREKDRKAYWDSLQGDPLYKSFVMHGGADTAGHGRFATKEEILRRAEWAERLPGPLGYIVRTSNRAFAVQLTELRMDVYRSIYNSAEKEVSQVIIKYGLAGGKSLTKPRIGQLLDEAFPKGVIPKRLPGSKKVNGVPVRDWRLLADWLPVAGRGRSKMLKDVAKVVNWGTGRGTLGPFEKAGGELGSIMFAPRFVASRLQAFSPRFYMRLSRPARRAAIRSAVNSTVLGATTLELAWLAGAKVGTDPSSSDFGKIVIGDDKEGIRVDVWSGHAWLPRIFTQISLGLLTTAKTGKQLDLSKSAFLNEWDLFRRSFFEQRAVPSVSSLINLMAHEDFKGDPTSISQETLAQVTPIVVQDIYDLWEEEPWVFTGLGAASFFGVSVQHFGEREIGRDLAEKTGALEFEEEQKKKLKRPRKKAFRAMKKLREIGERQ